MLRSFAFAFLLTAALHGQTTVCDAFNDLKSVDGRELLITGDLILSKNISVLGALGCDNAYVKDHYRFPTAFRLRPSAKLPQDQSSKFTEEATKADDLRRQGKAVSASGVFSGRIHLVTADEFPAEFTFDSVEGLNVETLPDASALAVIPICDLFQNLTAYKGQRLAIRGETVSTFEGSWITGRCEGNFVTNGYRWPVVISYGSPAYYARSISSLVTPRPALIPPKNAEAFRGHNNVIRSSTYVGRLRMRDEYIAVCRGTGDYMTNGFGHLNGAVAELFVEEVRDSEYVKGEEEPVPPEQGLCEPPNLSAFCAKALLAMAAAEGCADRVAELLSKDGIDSKDGSESTALSVAIRRGQESIVSMLLRAGAPVNPKIFSLEPPIWEAARFGKIAIIKILLETGANVDAVDHNGGTYLASYGYFSARVLKTLLDAGGNVNARDGHGRTALMNAANYGYENAVVLLIAKGALIDQKDDKGWTALMHAAEGKFVDAIPHLLEHGADPLTRNPDGQTALDLARLSKNEVAVELLTAAAN